MGIQLRTLRWCQRNGLCLNSPGSWKHGVWGEKILITKGQVDGEFLIPRWRGNRQRVKDESRGSTSGVTLRFQMYQGTQAVIGNISYSYLGHRRQVMTLCPPVLCLRYGETPVPLLYKLNTYLGPLSLQNGFYFLTNHCQGSRQEKENKAYQETCQFLGAAPVLMPDSVPYTLSISSPCSGKCQSPGNHSHDPKVRGFLDIKLRYNVPPLTL